jgi:hypothetical protein
MSGERQPRQDSPFEHCNRNFRRSIPASKLVSAQACLVLVVAAGGYAVGSSAPAGPGPQGEPADEQSYYEHVYTLIDLALPELLADYPELQGLQPASDQQRLPAILSSVGETIEKSYHSLPDIAATEEITQNQFGYNDRKPTTLHSKFGYLILVNRGEDAETLREYRTDSHRKPVQSQGGDQGFPFTKDFASMWVLLYPENQSHTKFRLLGRQSASGQEFDVVAFAEQPGQAVVTGRFNAQGGSALLLYQGVVWIDSGTSRIARLRLDLLTPRLDVALERQTTEIRFGEVHVTGATTVLWLPQEVTVTTVYNGQLFRNRHVYSGFGLFTVSSQEAKPGEPAQ